MNYLKIYNNIIERAKLRNNNEYTEKHHILPKCMGGDNSKDNLVNLTAREHFISHMLLVKIYPEKPSLIYAVKMMTMGDKRINNKMYEWLRVKESTISKIMNSGINNPFYGKTHSESTKKKISKKAKGRVISEETKQKIKESRKYLNFDRSEVQKKAAQTRKSKSNEWHSYETIEKIKKSKENISESTKKKISKKAKGRVISEETKQKMSIAHKGKEPWNKGLETNNDIKNKISNSMKKVEKYNGNVLCEYGCNTTANYKKYSTSKKRYIFMCEKSHNSCNGFKERKKRP